MRRSVSSVATAGSADSGISGAASAKAASRPAGVHCRTAVRTVFLVSLATIDSSDRFRPRGHLFARVPERP